MTRRGSHIPPRRWRASALSVFLLGVAVAVLAGGDPDRPPPSHKKEGASAYRRIKDALDATPAISTHEHLRPFDQLAYVETAHGRGMNLASLLQNSYYPWVNPLTSWKPGEKFDAWWSRARHDFDNARATGFYRSLLPAFKDLYGVDFDRLSDAQARDLDRRIYRNYLDQRWLYEVVTRRANIELMLVDPFWARFDFRTGYPFSVLVLNVTTLVRGFHPSEFATPNDDPYHFARQKKLKVESLDDYLAVLDRLFAEAKAKGAVCLKTTLAYQRTLRFEDVPKERAARAFGKKRSELTPEEVKEFEDFIMWRLVGLSARHGLPFQIHTGHARIQGSNPMLLADLIEANPRTRFILFHGGYPWVGETGALVTRFGAHVWVDSCWLPTISYTMAKRAYHEWLEVMPSNRILWGADALNAETIYAYTEVTRRCLAEVLAEKVERGDLIEEHALKIGRQILRDNALELFPQLKGKLWKKSGKLTPPGSGQAGEPGSRGAGEQEEQRGGGPLLSPAPPLPRSPAKAPAAPELLSRAVVFNYPETDPYDPGNRYGFNHAPSVTRLANGDLLCAWFSGPYEAAVNQVILAARSRDGGATWEKAFVLHDTPRKSDFDPAFLADGEHTWLFFSAGRWNRYPFVSNEHRGGVGPRSYHTYYRRSSDGGRTWSEPVQGPGTFFCRSNGIKLSSGELLLPVYTVKDSGDEDQAHAFRSTDGGKTWKLGKGITCPGGTDEPTLAEVSEGRVLMILRTRDGFVWRTYSKDKGETWSPPEKTDLPAAAASHNLFRLRDGRLVLTHGPSRPPFRTPLTTRLSADDGRTWGRPLTLAEATPPPKGSERQVTYPSVTQLRDGTLVVVWADIGISDTKQYGDIWSARVRVPAAGRP